MKNNIALTSLSTCLLMSTAHASEALSSIGLEYGQADSNIEIFGLTYKQDATAWLKQRNWNVLSPMDKSLEISAFQWTDDDSGDDTYGASASLVFDYEFESLNFFGGKPFVGFSTGIALLSETNIGEIDMSSAFQFKNQALLGLRFDSWELSLQGYHISNAGFVDPNDGIDIASISISYRF